MASLPKLGITDLVRTTTSTVGSVIQIADIFTSYIDKVREDQKIDHALHRAEYADRAIQEAAQRRAERLIQMEKFASKSEQHLEHLQSSIDFFKEALKK